MVSTVPDSVKGQLEANNSIFWADGPVRPAELVFPNNAAEAPQDGVRFGFGVMVAVGVAVTVGVFVISQPRQ